MPRISKRLSPQAVRGPSAGLHTENPPHLIPDNATPLCQNMRIDADKIQQIPGYVTIGSNFGLTLDGTDDSLSVTDAAQTGLDIVGSITVEALIRPTSVTGTQIIAAKWGNGVANQSYRLYLSGTSLVFEVGDGTSQETHTGGTVLAINTVYRVKGTWNVSGRELVTYVNGTQEATAVTTTLTAIGAGGAAFRLGADNSAASDAVANFFTGQIGYVRVSDEFSS